MKRGGYSPVNMPATHGIAGMHPKNYATLINDIRYGYESMQIPLKTFFISPPDIPTQHGPENIFYDFNDGARVLLPEGKWHVRLLDADSGCVFS